MREQGKWGIFFDEIHFWEFEGFSQSEVCLEFISVKGGTFYFSGSGRSLKISFRMCTEISMQIREI